MPTQQEIQQEIQSWVPNAGAGGGNPNTAYNNPPVPMSDALGNWVTPTVGPAASITPQGIPQRSVTLTPAQFPELNIQPQSLQGWLPPPTTGTPLFPNLGGAGNQPGAGWGVTRPPTAPTSGGTPSPAAPTPGPTTPSGSVPPPTNLGPVGNSGGTGWDTDVYNAPKEQLDPFMKMATVTYDQFGNPTYDFEASQREADKAYEAYSKLIEDPEAMKAAGIPPEAKSKLDAFGGKLEASMKKGGILNAILQVLDVITEPFLPGDHFNSKEGKVNWKSLVLGAASRVLGPLKVLLPLLSRSWNDRKASENMANQAGGGDGFELLNSPSAGGDGIWNISQGTSLWKVPRVNVGNLNESVGSLQNRTGGSDSGSCVVVSSYVHQMPIAGEIEVGDIMPTIDPVELTFSPQEVTYAETKVVPCVEVVTESGIILECSTTAPIADEHGNQVLAPNLLGVRIPTLKDGVFDVETVTEVNDIGLHSVRHITCGDKFFLAGKRKGWYLFHHNIKAIRPADPIGMPEEEIDSWLWKQQKKKSTQ